jgi:hypothetical protein
VLSGRAYGGLLVSEGMLGVPVGTYLYVFHRDWSLMYFFDGARVPSAIAVAIVAAYPLLATGGYVLGVALLRARRDALLGGLLVAVGVGCLALAIGLRSRLLQVGPFAGFHGGYGMSGLGRTALGPVAGVLVGTLGVGWTYVVLRSARESAGRSP